MLRTLVGTGNATTDKTNLGAVSLSFMYLLPYVYYFCTEDKGLILAIILITKPCMVYKRYRKSIYSL